jgi:hypothetical protein
MPCDEPFTKRRWLGRSTLQASCERRWLDCSVCTHVRRVVMANGCQPRGASGEEKRLLELPHPATGAALSSSSSKDQAARTTGHHDSATVDGQGGLAARMLAAVVSLGQLRLNRGKQGKQGCVEIEDEKCRRKRIVQGFSWHSA